MKTLKTYIEESYRVKTSTKTPWMWTGTAGETTDDGKNDDINAYWNYDKEEWDNLPQYIFTFGSTKDRDDFKITTYHNEFYIDMYDYVPDYLRESPDFPKYNSKTSQQLLNRYGNVIIGMKLYAVCLDDKYIKDFVKRCENVRDEKRYNWKKVETKNL